MCHSLELLFKYAMNEEGVGTVPEAFQELGINNLPLDCFDTTPGRTNKSQSRGGKHK